MNSPKTKKKRPSDDLDDGDDETRSHPRAIEPKVAENDEAVEVASKTNLDRNGTRRDQSDAPADDDDDAEVASNDRNASESFVAAADSQEDSVIATDLPETNLLPTKEEDFSEFRGLLDFGYDFDSEGRLRDLKTGNPFQFAKFGSNKAKNQRRYEALGEIVTEHVFSLLDSHGLRRIQLPVDASDSEAKGFVFATSDFEENPNLLVLVHGTGVVRAGQWSRRLIINDSLDSGSQLPYIREAVALGFAVLVLNTNYNKGFVEGDDRRKESIRGSETAEKHGLYVWQNLIMKKIKLERVVVVAHSFGGVVTVRVALAFPESWIDKVAAVAFTDSVHSEILLKANLKIGTWFADNSLNWVTSSEEIDTPVDSSASMGVVPRVSAGHTRHENTSSSAFASIFEFFTRKLRKEKEDAGGECGD